jgi:hypothetical protein
LLIRALSMDNKASILSLSTILFLALIWLHTKHHITTQLTQTQKTWALSQPTLIEKPQKIETWVITFRPKSLDECMAKLDDVVATIIKDVGYGNT